MLHLATGQFQWAWPICPSARNPFVPVFHLLSALLPFALCTQSYYRVSDCTGPEVSSWSLSIGARFTDTWVGFIQYRLNIRLQGAGSGNKARLSTSTVNSTTSAITRDEVRHTKKQRVAHAQMRAARVFT